MRRELIRASALALLVAFPLEVVGQTVLAQSPPAAAAATPAEKDCNESRELGKATASREHGTGGWMAGSIGSGILLGLLGAGVVTAVAATSDPHAEDVPPGVNATCYQNGFTDKAKSKNTRTSIVGGLLGTVVFVAIYAAASD